MGEFDFDRWGTSAMSAMFPLWMLKYLPNMPACHIGIAQDARGPNNTITLGDVSTLSAMAEAVRVLQRGQADAIIAGGVNSRVHPVLWTRSQVVGCSQRADDPAAASRPFDATRDGVVVGEGAGSLVLETVQAAQARGAQSLARILGYCHRLRADAKRGASARDSDPPRHSRRLGRRRPRAGGPRIRHRTRSQHHRRRPYRGPGHPRRVGRRAGDGAEELFRPSWGRRRGRWKPWPACWRCNMAKRRRRSTTNIPIRMPDQRRPRRRDVAGPRDGAAAEPLPPRPSGGSGAGG